MPTKKIIFSLFFLMFLVLGSVIWGQKKLNSYLNTALVEQPTLFTINNGSNFHHLGNSLLSTGIITDLTWWKVLGKLHPELTSIKSGTYQFEQGFTLNDILTTVNQGIEHQFIITLVEGSTFQEWLPILNNAPLMKPLEETEQQILARLGSPHGKLEGLLFPETYHYSAGMSAFQVITKAYRHQLQILEKLWAERDKNLPLKTPYEALILASIVEKESGLSADRDKIA
ncbi:MAG TPA: endolytic transglycosylase MltG, partial [Psychromonas sp.]